ncbi:MAG: hypothetical protein RJA81_1947, partial [Planctomycetota bacterium]
MKNRLVFSTLFLCGLFGSSVKAQWKPAPVAISTPWAAKVNPDSVLPEYPRPQLVRHSHPWWNLNGLWDYALTPKSVSTPPQKWSGKILVPFAIESSLSGVGKTVGPDQKLWYHRTFEEKIARKSGERIILNFGAIDWQAEVWLNGKMVGSHTGGYDPFSVDLTGAWNDHGVQELIVTVWDPSDANWQPRGKQVEKPEGIWYTSVTGIWQTVWLEVRPEQAVDRIQITPDLTAGKVVIRPISQTSDRAGVKPVTQVSVFANNVLIGQSTGQLNVDHTVKIDSPRAWSPEDPYLYDIRIQVIQDSKVIDDVTSYVGMRSISIGKDEHGVNRILLNGRPYFMYGPLDQGWWPDGLYTAPTDEALRFDVEITKRLGFNMARKHVKVEPARWYYHADRLGLLVWQDMPSGDKYIRANEPDITRTAESAANFRKEWRNIMDSVINHPCIVVWVPFNEGWGQFETDAILAETKAYDPTRLVDGPSGWSDRGTGDLNDMHKYPGPGMPPLESKRAVVLGEYGGLGLPVKGHTWQNEKNWGYRSFKDMPSLRTAYADLIKKLKPLIAQGLSAAIYTQTTDVEIEVNGLLTYDRQVMKFDEAEMRSLHAPLYQPMTPIRNTMLVPTGEQTAQQWQFITKKGWSDLWYTNGFDADGNGWETGDSGFGTKQTPNTVVRTEWNTPQIWIRKKFALEKTPESGRLILRIHHDETAEVYINGVHVAKIEGFTSGYEDLELPEASKKA